MLAELQRVDWRVRMDGEGWGSTRRAQIQVDLGLWHPQAWPAEDTGQAVMAEQWVWDKTWGIPLMPDGKGRWQRSQCRTGALATSLGSAAVVEKGKTLLGLRRR